MNYENTLININIFTYMKIHCACGFIVYSACAHAQGPRALNFACGVPRVPGNRFHFQFPVGEGLALIQDLQEAGLSSSEEGSELGADSGTLETGRPVK